MFYRRKHIPDRTYAEKNGHLLLRQEQGVDIHTWNTLKFEVHLDGSESFYWLDKTGEWITLAERVGGGLGYQTEYTSIAMGGTTGTHIGMDIGFRNLIIHDFGRQPDPAPQPIPGVPNTGHCRRTPLSDMKVDLINDKITSVDFSGDDVITVSGWNSWAKWSGSTRRGAPLVTVSEPTSQHYSAQIEVMAPYTYGSPHVSHAISLFGRTARTSNPKKQYMPFVFGLSKQAVRLRKFLSLYMCMWPELYVC